MGKRFVIEGEWSGYRSSQQRVVHLQVYPSNRKKFRKFIEDIRVIHYTDGTCLCLKVRDCVPRERVKEIRGYTSLIEDCFHYNTNSVSDLTSNKEEIRNRAKQKQPTGDV